MSLSSSGLSSAKVEREDFTLRAADGYELAATRTSPLDGSARAMVILNPATAVARRFYSGFAVSLAQQGFAVIHYDYRGIGGSRPRSLRGFKARMLDWARLDFASVLSLTAERHANARRFVIGHSFGGQALGLEATAGQLDGAVLIAAQSGYWGHWSGVGRVRLYFFWHLLFPIVSRFWGYFPGRLGIGEDLPKGVALEWARWGRHPLYAFGHIGDAKDIAARFSAPLLALSFSDDTYAPKRSVDAFLGLFSAASVDHRHLRPDEVGLPAIGHFGFFQRRNARLWSAAVDWLKARADEH